MTQTTATPQASGTARHRQKALQSPHEATPAEVYVRGLRVELAKCSPHMRHWLLEYSSPNVGGVNNPLANLEAIEESTLADATARLSCELIAARRDDDAIEDALATLRGHLEEHFLQRKYARLYDRRGA